MDLSAKTGSASVCLYAFANTTTCVPRLTFLDNRHLRDLGSVVSGHGEVCQLDLCWGQESGGVHGGVIEDVGAVALPTAFPAVAVNSSLKLAGGTQSLLFTFVRIEVFHIPAGEDSGKDGDVQYLKRAPTVKTFKPGLIAVGF